VNGWRQTLGFRTAPEERRYWRSIHRRWYRCSKATTRVLPSEEWHRLCHSSTVAGHTIGRRGRQCVPRVLHAGQLRGSPRPTQHAVRGATLLLRASRRPSRVLGELFNGSGPRPRWARCCAQCRAVTRCMDMIIKRGLVKLLVEGRRVLLHLAAGAGKTSRVGGVHGATHGAN
jgi:hypothetical protein